MTRVAYDVHLSDGMKTANIEGVVTETGIRLGTTVESGDVRIHRYVDVFKISDISFAGKRGRKVAVMHVSAATCSHVHIAQWMERMSKILPAYTTYAAIKAFFGDILADYPNEIRISESTERGVDVAPRNSAKLCVKTDTGLEITADPVDFLVVHKGFVQDTLYGPRGKRGIGEFYAWLKANLSRVNGMTIADMRCVWTRLGIAYDTH